MCGFVAWIGRNQSVDRNALARMLGVIHHRGPDDEGTYFSGSVGFGFRRLAILDLTPAGHQPMTTPDGRFTIVFNGEIYNYIELRQELSALGHHFLSSSDTEVLLHAYAAWGEKCLERLNGMWAFLIHDHQSNRIFGARDRFGMKPLYYQTAREATLFASEIKSIRVSGIYQDSINWSSCASYFHEQRIDETDDTFFENIKAVPAGHSVTLESSGELRVTPFWSFPAETAAPTSPPDEFAALFEDAVGIHMRSDVPVGVNLSGGLDSTSIICSIARHRERAGNVQDLQSFCYTAREFDESAYLAATLAQTGAQQQLLALNAKQLWNSLPQVLWYQDEPVHSITAVVGFHLSKLAADSGIKVVLNGQGADETLGGYPSYFRDYWLTIFRREGYAALEREIAEYCTVHGGSTRRILKHVLMHSTKTGLRQLRIYRRMARRRQLRQFAADDWFDPSLVSYMAGESESESGDLQTSLRNSVQKAPLPLYLRVEDRNAMASSIEARLPFLDPRVVEFASRLPANWKLRGPWNKFILREAMRGRIPECVRTRPDKMGFPTPFSNWLRNELYESASSILSDRTFADSGPFRADAIRRDLERHRRGEIDVAAKLFSVLQFSLWRAIEPATRPAKPVQLESPNLQESATKNFAVANA